MELVHLSLHTNVGILINTFEINTTIKKKNQCFFKFDLYSIYERAQQKRIL